MDTPRRAFDSISGHPMAQWSWYINTSIPLRSWECCPDYSAGISHPAGPALAPGPPAPQPTPCGKSWKITITLNWGSVAWVKASPPPFSQISFFFLRIFCVLWEEVMERTWPPADLCAGPRRSTLPCPRNVHHAPHAHSGHSSKDTALGD